jgi:hypothetical protein
MWPLGNDAAKLAAELQELTRWGPFSRLVTWWRGGGKEQRRSERAVPRKPKSTREDFIKTALEIATTVEAGGDAEKMRRTSYKLLRLDLYPRAWELRTRAAELDQPSPLPEWDGSDLDGRTVLVRAYMPRDRIGEELRLARFFAPVAKQARRCIVLGERRLVPLLQRSFDGIEVRPRGIDDAAAFAEADVGAYYESIVLHCVKTAEDMRRAFVPLRADPTRVASIRQRYQAQSRGPLLGISWGAAIQTSFCRT